VVKTLSKKKNNPQWYDWNMLWRMVDFTGLSRGLILVTFLNKRGTMPNHIQAADWRNAGNEWAGVVPDHHSRAH
jgi:hypothetical protein